MMQRAPANIRPALPADADGIARVHVGSWQTTYQGIVAEETLAGLSVERRVQNWLQQIDSPQAGTFVHVAEKDGEIIGFASGGPEHSGDRLYKGEIYALYLLQDFQRQGIGRMLVEASVISLLSAGFSSMLIWVLRDNPSRKFYEAIGGTYLREQDIDINGQKLIEVAYAWDNLHSLVKKTCLSFLKLKPSRACCVPN